MAGKDIFIQDKDISAHGKYSYNRISAHDRVKDDCEYNVDILHNKQMYANIFFAVCNSIGIKLHE